MKIFEKAINYFWVALIASLATYGLVKYHEFSSVSFFYESKIGLGPSSPIVKIEDLSGEPGAVYNTYRINYYLADLSLPLTTVTYVSQQPLGNVDLMVENIASFKVISNGKTVVSYQRGAWTLHEGMFSKL